MNREKYFTTKEVISKVNISRNTLFLWLKKGKVPEVIRDRNGHRLFTREDIQNIRKYKNKTIGPKTSQNKL